MNAPARNPAPDTRPGPDRGPTGHVLISPSQLKTYLSCARKWGFEYLEGIRPPGSKATELGSAVHTCLEEYYRDGIPPSLATPAGKIALAYISEVSRPPGTAMERAFTLDGRWRGFIDAIGAGFIEDTKTTSDLKWAMDEEALRDDPQALIYAAHYLDTNTLATDVELRWNYVTTRPLHKVKKVHLRVTRSEVDSAMVTLNRLNDALQAHYADNNPEALPRSTNACNRYGGCPHRETCQPNDNPFADESPTQMTTPTTAIPYLIRAEADGWKVHPNNPSFWYKKGATPKEVILSTELEALYPEPPAPPAEPEVPAVPQSVNPPASDFRPPASGPVAAGTPVGGAPLEEGARPSTQSVWGFNPPAIDSTPGSIEAALAEVPAEKRGRGRPPGAKNKPKSDPPIQATGSHMPAPVVEAPVSAIARGNFIPDPAKSVAAALAAPLSTAFVPSPVAADTDVPVLYIDCIPMSFGRPIDLVREMLPKIDALAAANKVAHWRQVPYGQGTALVVLAAREVLRELGGSRDLFLDTRTDEGSAVLSTCVEHITVAGGFAVRGLR